LQVVFLHLLCSIEAPCCFYEIFGVDLVKPAACLPCPAVGSRICNSICMDSPPVLLWNGIAYASFLVTWNPSGSMESKAHVQNILHCTDSEAGRYHELLYTKLAHLFSCMQMCTLSLTLTGLHVLKKKKINVNSLFW
jgi:hypothetical protein